ncbi:hypothetical protein SDC9_203226 [bioreactor metagenome]|uniref:Uncharacterized protein n=1 Tax=bioreactor metagenome TaxID=1076179 RepID=A0A645IXG4_9ZZZZ
MKKPGTRPPISPTRIRESVSTVRVTRIAFSSSRSACSEPGSAWTWKYGTCIRYMKWEFMFAAQNELLWRRPPFGSGSFIDQRTTGTLSRWANIGTITPSEKVMKWATIRSGCSRSKNSSSRIALSSRSIMQSPPTTSTPGRPCRYAFAFFRAASSVSLVQFALVRGR